MSSNEEQSVVHQKAVKARKSQYHITTLARVLPLTGVSGGTLQAGDLVLVQFDTGALAGARARLAVLSGAAQRVAIETPRTQLTVVAGRVVAADTLAWGRNVFRPEFAM